MFHLGYFLTGLGVGALTMLVLATIIVGMGFIGWMDGGSH